MAGCVDVEVPPRHPGPTTTTTEAAASTPPVECENPLASLAPEGPATTDVPADRYMAEIQERGFLRVGVDTGTMLLGSVNPQTRDLEGFDVDIAREIAGALFGERNRVELIGIPSSDRVVALTDGRVDLVASAFTVNCERLEDIEFSSVYFEAGQRILVRDDSGAESVTEMADADGVFCASAGSTAVGNIKELAPDAEVVEAPQRLDCLALLQEGEVDALATDDAILAGMAAQDENLEVRGDPFSDEPYGLGLPPDRPEWERYVNAVLEDVRASGRWTELYQEWFSDLLEDDTPSPPAPEYEG